MPSVTILLCGAVAGLIAGLLPSVRLGCLIMLAVPIAMLAYIYQWQAAHPESLTSTSGLDFVFGPLWPTLGAIGGYLLAKTFRSVLMKRDD